MTLTVDEIESTYVVPTGFYDSCRAYWVPIALRETVLNAYREAGVKVRLRYRGPRSQAVGRMMPRIPSVGGFYSRSRTRAMQDCLIADATHFTVYTRR